MSVTRGHWPAGKRRNQVSLQSGEDVATWLADLHDYCAEQKATASLARHLACSRTILYRYFTAEYFPSQERLSQMEDWLNEQSKNR